jgi:cold shock CspA family protein
MKRSLSSLRAVLLAAAIMPFSFPSTLAWVVIPPQCTTSASSKTRAKPSALFLFDWMNPKKETNDTPGDIFGNMFKIHSPPTTQTTTSDQGAELTMEETVAATIEAPIKEEETKDDFVVASFNDEGPSVDSVEESQVKDVTASKTESHAGPLAMITPDTDAIYHGKVRWFDSNSGYGFISVMDADGNFLLPRKDNDNGIFVHQRDIHTSDPTFFRRLYNRELVEFRIATDVQGRLMAKHVTGVGGAPLKCVQKQEERRKPKKQNLKED